MLPLIAGRPTVRGKFLVAGGQKLYVRGVTYGTFRPSCDGSDYPDPATVLADFANMATIGINAVRVYTVPPRWLLDAAWRQRLRVLVGLPWEQHVTFLDDVERTRDIEARVRAGVRACAAHPALLAFAVGNEIPSTIVRWYGKQRVERFIARLAQIVKEEDPGALTTYVNYPSTEFLDVSCVDFISFNVYLESVERLEAYLARLQNLAGDRPLVMAEIGLDSRRHGVQAQAAALDWQVRSSFAAGCAGSFVFAWTDEWHRGGYDVDDWDFGLVDRDRQPKAALHAVRRAYADVPYPPDLDWPRVSVVVCTYNGGRTIRDCCEALLRLRYPDFEVIVVDDGSTDDTAAIVGEYDFEVISTENRGLSSARNSGLARASGEIVAYIDDDAYPDPDWLTYLAATFLMNDFVGVGGPNLPPPGDGLIADAVANAPGGPIHVLLTDRVAEHIPGCNMAFRASALHAIGGFDPRFRAAGDDVDVCWRLQERGGRISFSPSAVVWHRRRNSLRGYWKQQRGYGKAEALLEEKWPEKYNSAGHVSWTGRLYGKGLPHMLLGGSGRIYHGIWGSAAFQSVYQPAAGMLASLPLMPEWYLGVLSLVLLGAVGLLWPPMVIALVAAGLGLLISVAQAGASARRASFGMPNRARHETAALRLITALLHLVQPVARLRGRLEYGLTPWRRRGVARLFLPIRRQYAIWSERWEAAESRLERLERGVRLRGALVWRGDCFDRWDLHARGGLLGGARLRMAIEEHGAGQQLVRFKVWPTIRGTAVVASVLLVALAAGAMRDGAVLASTILASLGALLIARSAYECTVALSTVHETLCLRGCDEPVGSLADPRPITCERAAVDLGPAPAAASETTGAAAE